VVMEPTGLAWLPIALFLQARFPQAVLVRAKEQKVVGLRRFLGAHAKSNRLDAITLAKLPLLDPKHLTPPGSAQSGTGKPGPADAKAGPIGSFHRHAQDSDLLTNAGLVPQPVGLL
jgi:hypothetical protein